MASALLPFTLVALYICQARHSQVNIFKYEDEREGEKKKKNVMHVKGAGVDTSKMRWNTIIVDLLPFN